MAKKYCSKCKKHNVKYSFILPIYKVEDYLVECVDSILKQKISDYELILVDDGSPDNCPKICDELSKKDKRIRVIHKRNGGLSAARNTGMKAARGKYYLFVDPDDYLEDDYLEIIDENIDDCDLLIFSYYDLYKNTKIKNTNINATLSRNKALIYMVSDDKYCGYAWNKVYKKSVSEKHNLYFDPNVVTCEDVLFAYEYIKKAHKIKTIDSAIINYRQRKSSIVSKKLSEIKSKPLFDTYGYFIEDTDIEDVKIKSEALYLKYYYKYRKYIDETYINKKLISDIIKKDYSLFSKRDKRLIKMFKYLPFMRSILYSARNLRYQKFD